jgi:hypothetical protein
MSKERPMGVKKQVITNMKLDHFSRIDKIRKSLVTFVSSESFNTYVNLFSLRGRVELFGFPTLPPWCIAETVAENR